MGQQMSGPNSSIGQSIRHESEGWGFESPSGRDIFCLKNFQKHSEHPFVSRKINAVARAKLTFQMLTLLQNNASLKHDTHHVIINAGMLFRRLTMTKQHQPHECLWTWIIISWDDDHVNKYELKQDRRWNVERPSATLDP